MRVPVRIAQRELHRAGFGVRMRLFFQPLDEGACAAQRVVEIVDAKEQQQTVAGLGTIWVRERRVIVRAPFVQAQRHRSIVIQDCPR
jgi:hypothetical protein